MSDEHAWPEPGEERALKRLVAALGQGRDDSRRRRARTQEAPRPLSPSSAAIRPSQRLRTTGETARAPGSATVLDLGGGHGEYALEFARRGLRATMQDRPTMIDIVGRDRRFEEAGVELFAGDFFELLPSARYDLVFCSGVTHTFDGEHNLELYRRLAPILAPSGCLAIQTFLRGRHPVAALFAVQMLANGGGADTHSLEEYSRWLAEAGFEAPETIDFEGGRRSLVLSGRRRTSRRTAPAGRRKAHEEPSTPSKS